MNSELVSLLLYGGGSVAAVVAVYLILCRIPWWAVVGHLLLGCGFFGSYQWGCWSKPMPPVEKAYTGAEYAVAKEKYPHRLSEWERERQYLILPPTVAMPVTWVGLLGGVSLLIYRWAAWANGWPTREEE